MLTFERTTDYRLIRAIITHPGLYRQMGDDSLPHDPERFEVNQHPGIWWILAWDGHQLLGLFPVYPENAICWQIHVAMLPETTTAQKWRCARRIIPWIWEHTRCRRIVAHVPATNKKAIAFGTHGMKLQIFGRNQQSFLHNGKLDDVVLMGRSRETDTCPA